jgi:low temperature requirement protein LtrA
VRTAADEVSKADPTAIRRVRAGVRGETSIEVFFDLVYAFAVTQLSHHLLNHATLEGALQTVLLLTMVWWVWLLTTGVTNWLNPNHLAVRLLLVSLMLVSLVMSASLPDAFGDRGLAVGCAYAALQIGRGSFAVLALRGDRLHRNAERVLSWSIVGGAFAVSGGIVQGNLRELLWVCAVGIEIVGGMVGNYTPGLGRSTTREWDIEGAHIAERCQSFVMIALGESIVVIGAGLAGQASVSPVGLATLTIAFAGAVAIWWMYFARSAAEATRVLAASPDPGRLGRDAYAYIHPLMIGGIIAVAAGDSGALANPLSNASGATTAMLLGGTVLFLAGHLMFKWTLWHTFSWTRAAAIAVLGGLLMVGPLVPSLAVAASAAGVVILVAAADQYLYRRSPTPAQ